MTCNEWCADRVAEQKSGSLKLGAQMFRVCMIMRWCALGSSLGARFRGRVKAKEGISCFAACRHASALCMMYDAWWWAHAWHFDMMNDAWQQRRWWRRRWWTTTTMHDDDDDDYDAWCDDDDAWWWLHAWCMLMTTTMMTTTMTTTMDDDDDDVCVDIILNCIDKVTSSWTQLSVPSYWHGNAYSSRHLYIKITEQSKHRQNVNHTMWKQTLCLMDTPRIVRAYQSSALSSPTHLSV